MQKPHWRRRSSTYLVESKFMRLRADEIELPDGTIIPNYYVRESAGFAIGCAFTPDRDIVLVRQYRYGSDSIHLELPSGLIDDDEEPLACVDRELREETGYSVASWELAGAYYIEPVRSPAKVYIFVGNTAMKTSEPELEPTEVLEVELRSLEELRAMLRDGRVDNSHMVCAGYRMLDYWGAL